MNPGVITWRRTFPDSAPGTDGVAIVDGRTIGRVRQDEHRAGKPWLWAITDPELAVNAAAADCTKHSRPDLERAWRRSQSPR